MKYPRVKFRFVVLHLPFNIFPVDTGRKLNVHKTFRRRPGRLLNVLCTFSLRPVSTGLLWIVLFKTKTKKKKNNFAVIEKYISPCHK